MCICSDKVFIAPSGVQKERIHSSDIFVLPYPQPPPSPHTDRVFLRRPTRNLKESACTPLFWNSFDLRQAGSCIHTHSQHAVMATLLWTGPVFTISHQVSDWLSFDWLKLTRQVYRKWGRQFLCRMVLIGRIYPDDKRCPSGRHWSSLVIPGYFSVTHYWKHTERRRSER